MCAVVPPRPVDTTPEAERVQVELLRAAPVGRRLHIALSLSATILSAAKGALARIESHQSGRELDLRFVEVHYGRDLASALRRDLDRRDSSLGA